MESVAIPNWAWAIIGGVVLLMLGIIGYLISDMINRYKSDIKIAIESAQAMKNMTCSFHHDSFRRVHDEREKSANSLEASISELNKNIGELKIATSSLSIHIENIAEKYDDNKAAIDNIYGRLHTIEGKIKLA